MRVFLNKGFGFVEAVVGIAICLGVLLGLMGVFGLALKSSLSNTERIEAIYLAEEGLEVVRILRDLSWGENITSAPNELYLEYNEGWAATTTDVFVDGLFSRSIIFEDVYRDGSHEIVESGGTLDPNIKKITASVSWHNRGATTTKSISTFLTNIFNN